MARKPRLKSATGIYHIMLRGINQQNIFYDFYDYKKFLDILATYKKLTDYKIYGYCLMRNHVHLLLREVEEEISNSMKRIGTSYAYWFNSQYGRKGHLFQDRFRSEPVENDAYLLTVIRYIHLNPVQAGITEKIDDYKWSSYKEYIGEEFLVDTEFILKIFDQNRDKSIQEFIKFNNQNTEDKCLEISNERKKKRISDREIKELFKQKYYFALDDLANQSKALQIEAVNYLKSLEGSSVRQLSRLTGFTVNKVFRF